MKHRNYSQTLSAFDSLAADPPQLARLQVSQPLYTPRRECYFCTDVTALIWLQVQIAMTSIQKQQSCLGVDILYVIQADARHAINRRFFYQAYRLVSGRRPDTKHNAWRRAGPDAKRPPKVKRLCSVRPTIALGFKKQKA